MHRYDRNRPLISVHVPKCAGSSFHLQVLRPWFKERLYLHYFDESANKRPPVYDAGAGVCIHGHFNHTRGCGVSAYYPGNHQQITVLRDPFELHLSNYFYIRRLGKEAYRAGKVAQVGYSLEKYLEEKRSFLLQHLPEHLTEDNFEKVLDETYLWIGISEQLQDSVGLLAKRLGFPALVTEEFNESAREQLVPEGAREQFEEKHPLEMAIYRHARSRLRHELGRADTALAGNDILPEFVSADRKEPKECRISVVVPAHNDEAYLESCIQSLITQTVQPDEIIICDDASTDGTRDAAIRLAEQYPDQIHCIFHEENHGCGGNFNSGIHAARGRYVSIVAADDYWLPQKLERELEALEKTGCRWAYSIVELAWEDGPHAGHQTPFWGTIEGHDGDLFQDILLRRVSPRSFLIERELMLKAGGFDEAFGMYEDWDLKLRLSARYPAAFVTETGAVYRQHSQGISRSDLQRQLAEAGKVLRKNKNLIEKFAPERATALRDSAWQKLLPGGKEEKNVPASLFMDYSPRRLDRRGGGLVFMFEDDDVPLSVALLEHPDLFCPPVLPIVEDLLTGMMTSAQEDHVTQDVVRAGLYAAWNRQLKESGRSRMLVCTRLVADAADRLHRIFPDARFVVSSKQGVSGALSESTQLVVMGQAAGETTLDSLCEALDLPRLFRPIQSPDKNYSRAADLIRLGEQQFAAGGLDAAEASFREALVCNAAAVDAYNNLAVVSWQRHDLAGALDLLSQGLALDSRHLDLLENTARILFDAGHQDDSEIFCKQYLAINPDNPGMVELLGQVQRATG